MNFRVCVHCVVRHTFCRVVSFSSLPKMYHLEHFDISKLPKMFLHLFFPRCDILRRTTRKTKSGQSIFSCLLSIEILSPVIDKCNRSGTEFSTHDLKRGRTLKKRQTHQKVSQANNKHDSLSPRLFSLLMFQHLKHRQCCLCLSYVFFFNRNSVS